MKLYLSPSNQPWNKYAVGGTTEKKEMEAVAKLVQEKLKDYVIDVVLATLSMSPSQRDAQAKSKGCTHYLAIHSNAGGGGKAQGAVAFYHPKAAITKTLASNLVAELNAVNPNTENRSVQVANGMALYDGAGLAEIREPYQVGVLPVLLEVDFHDNPITAKWIIDNKPVVAAAIVKALVKTFKLAKVAPKPTPAPAPKPTPAPAPSKSYKVNILVPMLNVRSGPGTNYRVTRVVRKNEVYTIVETKTGWGRLKSGAGWINVSSKYVKKA